MTTDNPILVIGANGKTGRRVAQRLRARDVPVRSGSRSGRPPFDWEDRSTWAPALRGTSAAYITFFPDLAVPGSPEQIAELAAVALREGTRRLVLLSGRGEEEAERAERALQDSGADWTIVRCSWFMQNFSEAFMVDQVIAGEIALPGGDVPAPFVDADDIADVVVAALTDEKHTGRLYDLTGPRPMTFAQAIGEIADATGRELAYIPISADEFAAGASAAGEPDDVVELLRYLFTEVLVVENAGVADGVRQALGRAPRDFADYARETASTGAWERPLTAA